MNSNRDRPVRASQIRTVLSSEPLTIRLPSPLIATLVTPVACRGHAQPDALAGATPYLKLMGDVAGGWMLGKQALAASKKIAAGEGDQAYWRTRIGLARVFAHQVLAQAPGLAQAVTQGSVDLFRATPELLGA